MSENWEAEALLQTQNRDFWRERAEKAEERVKKLEGVIDTALEEGDVSYLKNI